MKTSLDHGLVAQVPPHVRALLVATQETLGLLFDAEPTFGPGKASPAHAARSHDVNVIVGFTGAVQGQMLLGMTKAEAIRLASTLLMEELEAWGELTASGIAEIGNIVAGGCATALHQHGYVVSITVPSVVAGERVEVTWPNLFVLDTSLSLPDAQVGLAIGVKVVPD